MFFKQTQVLLGFQKPFLKLGYCFQLYSKSVVSNILVVSNIAGKNERLYSKDAFSLLVSNHLIKKKVSINNNLNLLQLNGLLQKNIQPIEEQCQRIPFYEDFLRCIEEQTNLEEESGELNHITTGLSQNLHLLSTEQIARLTSNLCNSTDKKSNPQWLDDLFTKLDQECLSRSVKWDKNMYINIAWNFHLINNRGFWCLHKQMVVDIARQIQQMTHLELVKYLSIVKQFRKFPHEVDMDRLEQRIYEVLDGFSIEDLGLICLAFFECNKSIRNLHLIVKLTERLIASPKMTDEKTIGSMLKIFRKSSSDSSKQVKEILSLQPRLYDRIDEWGPKVLTQLVSVACNHLYFHPPTIERVAKRLLTCMDQARLKDVERLAMAIAISCHLSPMGETFWNEVEKEFTKEERFQEISRYPHSFISLVAYAVTANRFPEGLLRIALSPKVIECAKKFVEQQPFYLSTKRELLLIHCSLNLEMPKYDGPRLKAEDVEAFEKLYRKPVPKIGSHKLCNHDAFLLLLLDTVRELLDKNDSASLVYLQPHFATPDVVFSLRSNKTRDSSDTRFVLVGGSRNMYSKFMKKPMGPLCLKIRQLELMGYRVIHIPWFEFLPLSQNDRLAFVRHEIDLTRN